MFEAKNTRKGCRMVSVLDFYSVDSSSNLAEVFLLLNCLKKNENKRNTRNVKRKSFIGNSVSGMSR